MIIDRNKYYYLIVGGILGALDNLYHFIYYHGIFQLKCFLKGKYDLSNYRRELMYKGHTAWEWKQIYKMFGELEELANYYDQGQK